MAFAFSYVQLDIQQNPEVSAAQNLKDGICVDREPLVIPLFEIVSSDSQKRQ